MAYELGLKGWVKNLLNGDVEIVAEGPVESVEKYISWCQKGPSRSDVTELKISKYNATGEFSDFTRR